MEIKDKLNEINIIGIISNYKSMLKENGLVKELNISDKDLILVGLNSNYQEKDISSLSINEKWKIELAYKLKNNIIIIGNMSKSLIYRDINNIKKLLRDLVNQNKKIIIIDDLVEVFIDLVKYIYVIRKDKIIYETDNYYDDKLYEYTEMPKIVEFIKYVNKDKKILQENIDIRELIKDIYRCVS